MKPIAEEPSALRTSRPAPPLLTAILAAALAGWSIASGAACGSPAAPAEIGAEGPQEAPPPPAEAPAPPRAGGDKPDSEAFARKADAIIDDRNFDAKSTAHFRVRTDDPRLDVKEAAALLESFRSFFDDFWGPRTTLRPHDEPSRIYLFYSLYKYRQLFMETERKEGTESIGHYRPSADIVVIHTDSTRPGDLADLIVHEAAHQLVQRALFGDTETPSRWLGEGLASYLGHTLREASGRFAAGEIGGKNSALIRGSPRIKPEEGPARLKEYVVALKKEIAEPIDDLIHSPDEEIYVEGTAERYTASWLLVHTLLHGEGGSRAAGFVRYLEREARGESGPKVFYREIGMEPEALQKAFKAHVLELKAR